jgi:hypothetical protein
MAHMSNGVYSVGDSVAPYLNYECVSRLLVDAGGIQMALAYSGASGPTSRILQGFQPTAALIVEWAGKRQGGKPQPPQITATGSFVLASAGGQCSSPMLGANAAYYFEASGYLVMLTASRPEGIALPAFWTPYQSQYDTPGAPVVTYTPEELGFGLLLPGQPGATGTRFRKPNNPPGQSGQSSGAAITLL